MTWFFDLPIYNQETSSTTSAQPADDSAFIFLSLEDLIIGTKHVRDHFKQFGLQIHLGTRSTMPGVQDIKSKMEAMYFLPYEMRKAEILENL